MKQNPNRELWNEFDWELELRKDDARVNSYANDLPKFIDLPDEDGVIMKRMQKHPDLAPAGGDWTNLGPVPYDSGDEFDDDEENPAENNFDWKKTPGAFVYEESARMARDWAAFHACEHQNELLVPSMKILCLYGKLMARSGDMIDMSLDAEDAEQSRPLRIALCKRLLADQNSILGILMKLRAVFSRYEQKYAEHEAVLGQMHDNTLDMLTQLRKS